MITKVISGGQIGADIAALRAAKKLGIETGGWAPLGYRTLMGDNLELRDIYQLEESDTRDYPPRTALNVHYADGTLRFAYNFGSAGERCTEKYIRRYEKPSQDISIMWSSGGWGINFLEQEALPRAIDWVEEFNIEILNVAGNGNSTIEYVVEEFMTELLKRVNKI